MHTLCYGYYSLSRINLPIFLAFIVFSFYALGQNHPILWTNSSLLAFPQTIFPCIFFQWQQCLDEISRHARQKNFLSFYERNVNERLKNALLETSCTPTLHSCTISWSQVEYNCQLYGNLRSFGIRP